MPVLQRGALDRSDCGHSASVSATGRQICCREEPLKTEARLWEVTTDHPWAVVVDSENSEPAGGAGCSTCALVARCSSVTDVVRLAGAVGGPWEPRSMPKRRLSLLNLPRIPVDEGDVTAVGLIAIAAAILTALIGALLGGLAGMRFHRKVDAEGLNSR